MKIKKPKKLEYLKITSNIDEVDITNFSGNFANFSSGICCTPNERIVLDRTRMIPPSNNILTTSTK